MANQEHLDILKQGMDIWNKWRMEHPNLRPDLSSASLSNANLSKFDLQVMVVDQRLPILAKLGLQRQHALQRYSCPVSNLVINNYLVDNLTLD
jgi:hypothetical protein